MSKQPQSNPEGEDVQRMLKAGQASHGVQPGPLAALLDAASAPPGPGRLAGEQTAIDAFRAARLGHASQQRRPSMIQALLTKLLTVKVAAAAAGVAVAGGVAFAAGTGTIPNPLRQPVPSSQATPSLPPQASPAPSESMALIGLCRAYLTEATNNPGTAIDAPAFQPLITAAGGKENITGYCTEVIAVAPVEGQDLPPARGAPTSTPSHPSGAAPTPSHPSGATPTPSHPTGPPVPTPGRRA